MSLDILYILSHLKDGLRPLIDIYIIDY
jgi:hypothetical protein